VYIESLYHLHVILCDDKKKKTSRSGDWWRNCRLRREKIFHEDILYGYDDLAGGCDRDAPLYAIQLPLHSHRHRHVEQVWAIPLKTKSGSEMAKAIAKIIQDDERCPKNLQINMRKEFYNVNVQKLLKKHDINHYSIYFVMKVHRTWTVQSLKNDMWKQFILYTMEIISGSTCYRVSYQSTMRKSTDYLYVTHRCYSHDRWQAFNHDVQSHKNRRIRAI